MVVRSCNFMLFIKLHWPGDSEGTFRSRVKLPPVQCPPHGGGFTLSFLMLNGQRKEAVNTKFYSLWFDPTGNQTRVYRLGTRRSIHSTTDR